MIEVNPLKIDIASILKEKAPNTNVPKFIVNYLRRIAHEKDLNKFFETCTDLKNFEFIEEALNYLDIKISMEGRENLPKTGRCIFAGNHPLGGLDGITTGLMLAKVYDNKIRFFSNDLLMNVDPLKELFIPVNKVGKQSKDYAALTHDIYESDNNLVTYPAGMCSRKINGKIVDLEWKKSFISKAIEYQRDVIPIYFKGRNSKFFYNLANLRKFLKIKINIEMLYLVDELYKNRGSRFVLRVGEPIPWQTFDKSKTQTEWAEWVKQIVYNME
ncbi:MAG: 1-acyl-sn-glycerol-3-phosphate acyltransferase [Paludibacter sp.]